MADKAIHRIKQTFSSGELSPLMDARLDFKRYNSGCHKLRNMLCTTQGPVTRRPGFKFIFDLSTLADVSTLAPLRLVPFIFNELQSYVMIFYHTIPTGESDGAVGPAKVVFILNQRILRLDVTNTELSSTTYPGHDRTMLLIDGSGGAYFTLTDTSGAVHIIDGQYIKVYSDDGTDLTISFEPTSPFPDVGTLTAYAAPYTEGAIVTLDLPFGWSNAEFTWAQSNDVMLFAQPDIYPYHISRTSKTTWDQGQWVPPANEPLTPVAAAKYWSDTDGWPEAITLHQQRLILGGSAKYRNTVWLSEAGDFTQFNSATADDSDSFVFTLDSGRQNQIRWLQSGKSLNIGTNGSEWTVVGSTQSALTNTSKLSQRQTNIGSEKLTPLMIGITTLFLERYGRTINEFVYDFSTDSYKTSDMSILSKHVTEKASIIDWTYQQVPDSIVWSVRSDGVLLGTTYQRQHEVIGWHVHETNGKFKAITSIPGLSAEDEVWALVRRNDRLFIELLGDTFLGDNASDGAFLDSYQEYLNNSHEPSLLLDGGDFTGLDRLDFETVSIVIDGKVYPDQVVNSGSVPNPTSSYFNRAVIGLGYMSEVWPTLSDLKLKTGTAEGRVGRTTHLDFDFYRTGGVLAGRYSREDGEQEEYLPFRIPTDATNQEVPLYTGVYHYTFPEGFSRDLQYFVRQTQPLPLTIRSIVDTVEVFK